MNWVGGFVIPLIPFFSVVNKNWKKRSEEAIIHENVHLWYLQNGALIIFILGLSIPLLLSTIFSLNPNTIIFVYSVCMMVLFEYVTFNKTSFYGKIFGINTSDWNKRLMTKYFFVYAVQLGIIIGIISGIKWLISLL